MYCTGEGVAFCGLGKYLDLSDPGILAGDGMEIRPVNQVRVREGAQSVPREGLCHHFDAYRNVFMTSRVQSRRAF